jgi:hypothetical protein
MSCASIENNVFVLNIVFTILKLYYSDNDYMATITCTVYELSYKSRDICIQ